MLAIAFRFPAGRYHATPWRRHVNEADVEWPPSPWRITRAIIATWHRKSDPERFPRHLLEALVCGLATELPVFSVPPAILAHTRHYMPVREGKTDKKVLVFDAFVRVDPRAETLAVWRNLDLSCEARSALADILRSLGSLGRAESWVEAELLETWDGEVNCGPADDRGEAADPAHEPLLLIAPVPPLEYERERARVVETHGLGHKKLDRFATRIRATLPERFLDALRLETGQIQGAGWSCPPAARFVTYLRPANCFAPRPRPTITGESRMRKVTTVRLALAGKPLPRIEDAVRLGELVRIAAIYQADRLSEHGQVPSVLSGHDLPGTRGHRHAFYLPEDAYGDGLIDHILIHAEQGLAGLALRALDALNRLWNDEGFEWQVLLEQYGSVGEIQGSAYTGPARRWISVSPYLHPWHRKKGFGVEDQICRECRERGLPEPSVERLATILVKGRERRSVHFHRFRSKRGLTQPDTQGSFWRLSFPSPIQGPLALGFGCHYGLGMFQAIAASTC
jgi:CRISPR-associated protein Csb2